jgi:carbamoyl-phosphate synthase small subunit
MTLGNSDVKQIKLVLEDGSIYHGYPFGAEKSAAGEVVFNTGMVGYPEALTDPSYKGQILTLTYPLIGNYGVPPNQNDLFGIPAFFESGKIQIQGLVVSEQCEAYHHWNAAKSLSKWLKEHNIPGIYGIDTRALTKKLREKGTMLGKIIYNEDVEFDDPNKRNLVEEVSIDKPVIYGDGKIKVVILDCGIKNNIIRCFLKRKVKVIRVPWDYDIFNPQFDFDGLFISNGPGDPKMCTKTIKTVRKAMANNIPIFGICLGNQILALAAGADTYKLKYGHRSQNQPCKEVGTKRCYITPQNHGYAVDAKSLPRDWQPWFENANDKTNEGIKHTKKPWFSIQFHPEAKCGPVDTEFLFDRFIDMIKNGKRN